MHPDFFYQLALLMVPNIGPIQAKILLQHFNAPDIFKAKKWELEKIEGIGSIRAGAIKSYNDYARVEAEIAFIQKFNIRPLFITDDHYPKRLLNCYDPPVMLFFKGEADLNHGKIVAVIGTRNNTTYGKQVTEKLVADLKNYNVLVVSGLAFGIDAFAHRSALKNNMPTVGVLAHGLDQVYPSQHMTLAKDMVRSGGGLLTEFPSNTKPDKHNFPTRNRVVAGMSDATIVIETGIKGGSIITAELANNYNRDVFAVPGKISDPKSEGCNMLIRNNKAVLLTNASEMMQLMGWEQKKNRAARQQKELFIDLNPDEKKIYDIIREKDAVHIDEINLRSGLSSSTIAAAILALELKNVVLSLPGKRYGVA